MIDETLNNIKMSSKGWYSKQDVIKDIVKVTGKKLDGFFENYVVGENPPQAWRTIEDDEDLSRFYGGERPMQSDDIKNPDLVGITQMLRMVDNCYERSNGFTSSNGGHIQKSKITKTGPDNVIVSISKLNPTVNEFVPNKIIQTSASPTSINIESRVSKNELKVTTNVSVSNVVGAKVTTKTNCCDTNAKTNISDNRIDISQLLSDELKEMREKLKTKICDTSKVKCVKLRRERNLAIATLLKLYCQPPAVEENKPNLISPDYFKNNPANKNYITDQNIENTVSKNNTDDNFTENILNTSSEDEIIKKEIGASVDKVTRWLHNTEPSKIFEQNNIIDLTPNITEKQIPIKKPTKPLPIHLGPMTFKRKTNNNLPTSPVSLQSDHSKTKSETFVPSVYASELIKKYIQQSKKKQDSRLDIWKSLETQLKEKDEAITKIRLQTII